MAGILWYPKECYVKDERITEQNKRNYEILQEKIEKRCLELRPDFHQLRFTEQCQLRDIVRKELGD